MTIELLSLKFDPSEYSALVFKISYVNAFYLRRLNSLVLGSQGRGVIMPSMDVVEFFQHEVQFPYGVIRRVSATLAGTLFLLSTRLFLLLTDFSTPSNFDSVDL